MGAKVLVIEDDRASAAIYRKALTTFGHQVILMESGDAGLARALKEDFDLVITDLVMPGLDGLQVLEQLHEGKPLLPIILLTGSGTSETAIEAMKRGAYDYLVKPIEFDALQEVVQKAIVNSQIGSETVCVGEAPGAGLSMIGKCGAMQQVFKEIGRLAAKPVSVLIRGETGTGKELVAQALYQHSARRTRPFIAINCAAIPETLLESELFGHERGSFTGAQTRRIGRFEQADHGTLFLDEIGELTPGTQAKLLRALQEQVIQRVGGNEVIRIDVRIIAATNRNLEEAIAQKLFREDLYYRLCDATIYLPQLRARREDIPLLIHYFINRHAKDLSVQQAGITSEALDYLQRFDWPGNVRQLQSFIRQAMLASHGYAIGLESVRALQEPPDQEKHHPFREYVIRALEKANGENQPDAYSSVMGAVERELLCDAIQLAKGNQSLAARWLGISRVTLRSKLAELGFYSAATPKEARELDPV